MTQFVKGYISTNEGYAPETKTIPNGKDVYEVHLSAKDANGDYENTTVSVWGKAIEPVSGTVEKVLAKDGLMIVFEGEYVDPPFVGKNGKTTYKFRAFDASPWLTSYPRR